MSESDLLIAVTGHVYIAPVDTVAPAETASALATPGSPWISLGSTSADDLPSWTSDGGSTDAKGTWQNPSARSLTATASEQVKFTLSEWNNQALSVYYGKTINGDAATPGGFAVNSVSTKEYALLITMNDMNGGVHWVAYHSSRASLGRGDDISVAVDDYGKLPILGTILQSTTSGKPLFSWLGVGGSAVIGPSGT